MTYAPPSPMLLRVRENRPDVLFEQYNMQDGGVSTDPDTLRGGPGSELTPRAGAAPRHEGKS